MASPFATFGTEAGAVTADATGAAVSHQYKLKPRTPATATNNKIHLGIADP